MRRRVPETPAGPVKQGAVVLVNPGDFLDPDEVPPAEAVEMAKAVTGSERELAEELATWQMVRATGRWQAWLAAQHPASLERVEPGSTTYRFRPELSPDGPPAPTGSRREVVR